MCRLSQSRYSVCDFSLIFFIRLRDMFPYASWTECCLQLLTYLVSCLVTYFRPPHFLPNDLRGASVFSALTLLIGRQEGPVKKN